MKIKFSLFFVLAALMSFLAPNFARADADINNEIALNKVALIGTWVHPDTKMVYTFSSDATYFVVNDLNKPYMMEQGYWKMVAPLRSELGEGPDMYALILKTRKRTTEVRGERVTKSAKRDERHLAGMVTDREPGRQQDSYYFDNTTLRRIS